MVKVEKFLGKAEKLYEKIKELVQNGAVEIQLLDPNQNGFYILIYKMEEKDETRD